MDDYLEVGWDNPYNFNTTPLFSNFPKKQD
jgi:hypothetical protein